MSFAATSPVLFSPENMHPFFFSAYLVESHRRPLLPVGQNGKFPAIAGLTLGY